MNDPVEQNAIENLVTRLTERYPSVGPERIRLIVDEEAQRLEQNPVRQYVPSLVEHAAAEAIESDRADEVITIASPAESNADEA